jgi:TolB-like protein/DNA-binding winged helix-turn-helix (wHTH) protein
VNPLPESPVTSNFRVLDLEVDLDRQTVRRDGLDIELPDLSFRLFAALIRHAPEMVSKDELVQEVWGGVVVSDETLSQRIRLLRQALGEDGQEPRYITSVRGRGYRLICDVAALESESERPSLHRHWPVVLTAIVAMAIAALWPIIPGDDVVVPEPMIHSIAVLPFTDLSPNQDHRYFADGMQEELLTRLAKIPDLKVASRTSVEQYRGTTLNLTEIGGALGVGAIIESSVRVADERVRITVQLIDAQTDRHLWAESYDRELSVANIFAIQQEVADTISRALTEGHTAAGADHVQLPTNSLDAYNAYLVGRAHTFAQTPEDLALAIDYLEQAVEIDPEFAEAWASLGWAYSFRGTIYGRQPPREVYPQAKAAVTRALAIDNTLADARDLYADILAWYDWDFAAAEREYKKALELEPLNVLGYALLLSVQQRHEEAIALLEQRIAANPDDAYVRINAGWAYLRDNRFEQAIAEASLAPNHTDARAILGFAAMGMGDIEGSVEIFDESLREQGRRPRHLSNLAIAYFEAGRDEEGRALMAELETAAAAQYVSPDLIADVHFAAGDPDAGFIAMNAAIEARSRGMIFILTNPWLEPYREDPRYAELVQAVGLD